MFKSLKLIPQNFFDGCVLFAKLIKKNYCFVYFIRLYKQLRIECNLTNTIYYACKLKVDSPDNPTDMAFAWHCKISGIYVTIGYLGTQEPSVRTF